MHRCIYRLILIPLIIPIAAPLYAEDTDLVVLTSGNRLTGVIREFKRGRLFFRINGAGGVDISWHNVELLESKKELDFELTSGEGLRGTIISTTPGQLEIKTSAGSRTIALEDIVWFKPVSANRFRPTSANAEGGFSFLQDGSVVDFTIDAQARNRTRNYLTKASLLSLVRRQSDADTVTRHDFELGARRFLHNRWFVLGQFGLEQDGELDLDLRTVMYGALGRTVIQSQRMLLALHGGVDYDREDYGGLGKTDHSAEALGGVEWDWFEPGGNTELLTDATTYVSFDRPRVRFKLESGLHRDIFRDFFWGVGVFEAFDSNPPADLKENDFGIAFTFGLRFGRAF